MNIENQNYYQKVKKNRKANFSKVFIWFIIVILILGLVASLIPPIR